MEDKATQSLALAKLNDLKVQAIIFDMEIDIETWSLAPKSKKQPIWLTRWQEKRDDSDSNELLDMDWEE